MFISRDIIIKVHNLEKCTTGKGARQMMTSVLQHVYKTLAVVQQIISEKLTLIRVLHECCIYIFKMTKHSCKYIMLKDQFLYFKLAQYLSNKN